MANIDTKKTAGVIIAVLFIGIAIYGISMYQRYRSRGSFAERIFSEGGTPETIEGLKNAIASYERQIERHVEAAAKTGTYWKILAVRLQDRGLHGDALDALEEAIYYSPEDASLHYSAGISAGIIAKSLHAFPEEIAGQASGAVREGDASGPDTAAAQRSGTRGRERYFALAEEAFLRAIELDDRYLRPRHSLGVLYVFDLDRPEEAIPHLEKCLEISRNEVDSMFVLARAFYMLERYEEAVELYDRIITLSRDEQKRLDAQNNRQAILGREYGG